MIKSVKVNASFIPLTQDQVAIVDCDDYYNLIQHSWYAKKRRTKYAPKYDAMRGSKIWDKTAQKLKKIPMHRFIMKAPLDLDVDHINGDTLDNRRSNLRVVTRRQNLQNTQLKRSSKYPGVTWHKQMKKWQSVAWINGRNKYLGIFDSEIEAFEAYKNALESLGEEVLV